MTCLFLNMLGEPQVLDADGKDLQISSRKALALMACLALTPGRSMQREDLVALLWGERFDQQGRQSLRQSLYALRRSLGDECAEVLFIDGETIGLDTKRMDSDAWRFEELVDAEDEPSLQEAANLHRGRLLAGIAIRDPSFEEWLTNQRQHFRDLHWRGLYRLAKCQKRRRDWTASLDSCRRLLDINPLREKTHRLIMRIHAQGGDRAAALQQYYKCEELLRKELNLEPDMTTIRTYEDIKASVPDADEDQSQHPAAATDSGPKSDGRYFSEARPAVAVLNFENLGGDPSQDYFAQAMTSDIATALSYWRWFPVIGQSSTSAFKNSSMGITEIARELDAQYVVTGTVRLAGTRVRIAVQLLDAATAHHLWAQRYDGSIEDIFDVQDEITEKIVAAVEPELMRAEHNRAFMKRADDLSAWDYVMRADWCKSELTQQRNAEAIKHLQDSIAIDPLLSIAWSHLAHCHWYDGIFGWSTDNESSFLESDKAARKAISLDDADWLAHTMLGLCDMWNRQDYDMSLTRHKRALDLNPSASIAHHSIACSLEFAGQPEEAINHLTTVMRLDPQYGNNAALLSDLSLSYLLLEQFEDSATYGRKAVSLRPDYARAFHRLASTLGHLGELEEAKAALDSTQRIQPDFCLDYVRSTYPFREKGHLDTLISGLKKAGMDR